MRWASCYGALPRRIGVRHPRRKGSARRGHRWSRVHDEHMGRDPLVGAGRVDGRFERRTTVALLPGFSGFMGELQRYPWCDFPGLKQT